MQKRGVTQGYMYLFTLIIVGIMLVAYLHRAGQLNIPFIQQNILAAKFSLEVLPLSALTGNFFYPFLQQEDALSIWDPYTFTFTPGRLGFEGVEKLYYRGNIPLVIQNQEMSVHKHALLLEKDTQLSINRLGDDPSTIARHRLKSIACRSTTGDVSMLTHVHVGVAEDDQYYLDGAGVGKTVNVRYDGFEKEYVFENKEVFPGKKSSLYPFLHDLAKRMPFEQTAGYQPASTLDKANSTLVLEVDAYDAQYSFVQVSVPATRFVEGYRALCPVLNALVLVDDEGFQVALDGISIVPHDEGYYVLTFNENNAVILEQARYRKHVAEVFHG